MTEREWADKGWADVRHEIDYVAEVSAGVIVEIYGAIRVLGRISIQTDFEMRRLHGGQLSVKMSAKSVFFSTSSNESLSR